MPLIDEYNAARDDAFGSRVLASLWGQAVTYLSGNPAPDPVNAADKRRIKLAREILQVEIRGARVIINALASAGLSNASTDAQIDGAIGSNWDRLSLMFDTNVTG